MSTRLSIFLVLAFTAIFSGAAPADRDEISAALLKAEKDPNSPFMVTTWQTGEGLPINVIQDLAQTQDGFLWLATSQGLSRFDGLAFKSFFSTPSGARYGSRVWPLEVDSSGRLWVGTDQTGIAVYHGSDFSEIQTNGASLRARAESLCDDGSGRLLWVDASGAWGWISLARPDQGERFEGTVPAGARWMRGYDGAVWLLTSRTAKVFENGKLRSVPLRQGVSFVAAPRREGGLWTAYLGKLSTLQTNGVSSEIATFPWAGMPGRVTALLEDSHGQVWVGTASHGIFRYASGEFTRVVPTSSTILRLIEDDSDNIWAGSRGGGLIRVRERRFFVQDVNSGLKNDFINSLAQDREGRIWMSTAEAGFGWWQNGIWTSLEAEHGWTGDVEVLSVCPSRGGGVWFSTINRELCRWNAGRVTRQKLRPQGLREPAMDLLEDHSGKIWMVTDNSGLYCFSGTELTRHTRRQGLPSLLIRRVIEDAKGGLWAGDWQGGIACLRGERWEIVRKPSGHKDAVRSMAYTDGAIWVGTSAGGLLRIKDNVATRITVTEGLPHDCVQQLLADNNGQLWATTPHQLFKISLRQLNDFMDGRRSRVQAITFGRSDGLPDTSFASWCDPRSWASSEGELWFATANGAVHFKPSEFSQTSPPRPLVDEVLLDGKWRSPESLEGMRPSRGRIEFRFTAPCLTAPDRVQFRYKLTGVDDKWIDAGASRSATYASVPPGRHQFDVIASSPEGVWGSQADTVRLSIAPYFWQTPWFFAAVAASTAGAAVWLIRRAAVRRLRFRIEKLRQEHALDQERARIARDIHDELGANLTSIGLLADMGKRHTQEPAIVARELNEISQAARESVAAMDTIVWTINPRNDSLDHLANYIAEFAREFFRPTNIRVRLDLPPNLPAMKMTTETRHQVFMVVKETFNNIVRHSSATEVNVALTADGDRLRLTIGDNGKGLPPGPSAEGQDGLVNIRERIAKLGGATRVESVPGKGTRLDFVLPIEHLKAN